MKRLFVILNEWQQAEYDNLFGDEWRKRVEVYTAETIQAILKELGE